MAPQDKIQMHTLSTPRGINTATRYKTNPATPTTGTPSKPPAFEVGSDRNSPGVNEESATTVAGITQTPNQRNSACRAPFWCNRPR